MPQADRNFAGYNHYCHMETKHHPPIWIMRAASFMGAYRPSYMKSVIRLISMVAGL